MSEDRSLSVKAYLDVGGGRQEVRRFGMPESLATNFTCLKDKVCAVFGLGNKDITLSWSDAEGDLIVISSDDELMEAIADNISRQNLQLLRITVGLGGRPDLGPNNSLPGNQQGLVHEGITCDGCEGPIRGFRYRCVSCQDFDLCGACEVKGLHAEHKMLRLPKPQPRGAPSFFWKEHEGPSGQYSSQFGMRGGEGGNTSTFSSTCTSGGGAGGGAWTSWGGPGTRHFHRRGFGGRGRGGWWAKNFGGKNWGGFAQGQSMNFGSGQQQQQQQQQQHQHQHQHQQYQQQQGSGNTDKEDKCPWTSPNRSQCPFMSEEHEVPNPQQVAEEAQQMAEEVAHHAHHFASQMASDQVANVMRGIWAAWTGQQGVGTGTAAATNSSSSSSSSSTSQDSQQQTSSDPNSKEKDQQEKDTNKEGNEKAGEEYLRSVGETVANVLDPLGIDVEVSVEHNGIRQRCSLSEGDVQNRQSPTLSRTPSPPKESESPAKSESRANMEIQIEDPQKPQAGGNSATAEVMEVCSPKQPSGEQMEAEQASSDTDDWTLVNQDASPEGQANAKPKTSSTQSRAEYPSLAEFQIHPNSNIQRALELMYSMGYSNEGGWLTYLLEMKEGDINQVLDILQPVSK